MIRWGILGAGDVAEVKSGPAFQKAEYSELIGVMRRDGAKAKDFAQRHGVPKWYDNADQLCNDPDINAIYVATPPKFHKMYAIKALEAGKFVYLEKPMARSLEESKEIATVNDELKGKLTIAHYRRALDAFIHIENLLEEKAIGDVRFVRISMFRPSVSPIVAQTDSNWRLDPEIAGGGLFHDLAPHQIDLMIKWFGKPTEIVGVSKNSSRISKADDIVSGEFTCQQSVVVQGTWCFSVAEAQTIDACEIFGSEGKITFSFFEEHEVNWQNRDGLFKASFEAPENVQLPMIQQVVNYFLEKGENPCSTKDALEVMRVLDGFTKSFGKKR